MGYLDLRDNMALCSDSRTGLISFSVILSASEDWLQTTVLNVLCGNQLCSLTRTTRVLVLRDSQWEYGSEVTFPCSAWVFGTCRDFEGWRRMETERQLTGENQRISDPEWACSWGALLWNSLVCEIIAAQYCAKSASVYVPYSLLVTKDVYVEKRFNISIPLRIQNLCVN